MPTVQIGLPVYNGENYLADAIESFLSQTYSDFEILISDNGSTDRTQEIAEKYAERDPRVRYFRYDVNQGAAWNFNNVVHLATAEFFCWAAHDDLRHPEFLERCLAVLTTDAQLACCYAATQAIDADGEPKPGYYADRCHVLDPRPSVRFSGILGRYPMHVLFGVMRREAMIATRLWGGYASADRVFTAELSLHGKIHELPEQLFLRRWHDAVSWTADTNEKDYSIWYDPKNAERRFSVPKARRGIEYAKAIAHARLSPVEAASAYLRLAWFTVWFHGVRSIARNVRSRIPRPAVPEPA